MPVGRRCEAETAPATRDRGKWRKGRRGASVKFENGPCVKTGTRVNHSSANHTVAIASVNLLGGCLPAILRQGKFVGAYAGMAGDRSSGRRRGTAGLQPVTRFQDFAVLHPRRWRGTALAPFDLAKSWTGMRRSAAWVARSGGRRSETWYRDRGRQRASPRSGCPVQERSAEQRQDHEAGSRHGQGPVQSRCHGHRGLRVGRSEW
jgi:hypothetical protein